MSREALSEYTLRAKYARYNKEAKRRESYAEATNRVREMMLGLYPQAREDIDRAYDLVLEKRILGSQRALQFGGKPALQHNARVYNCTSSYCDRLRFFQEALYLLLCGCGTGFSVQKHHVASLPAFADWRTNKTSSEMAGKLWREPVVTYVIPDTIEGWSDALGVLLSSYFDDPVFPEYAGVTVQFDYSQIRPEGSYLSSGAGKAPGPEPLKRALENIRSLLEDCLYRCMVNHRPARLRPIDAYDIVMHASDAVLAGGVRRSATICIFSPDDMEMMTAKTGDWFKTNPQRGRSNNSVLLLRGSTSRRKFKEIIKHVREWGEPGFYWSDSTEQLPNPCVEIGFYPQLRFLADDPLIGDLLRGYKGPIGTDGCDLQGREFLTVSGWQFCNLTTINGSLCRTPEEFYDGCEGAAAIGTFQAAMTSFPYLGPITEAIVRREALLGVSITGVMDSPNVLLQPDVLREGARRVLECNRRLAPVVGINVCARGTCLKPEGTSSCLLGTASGASMWKFRRGFRRVQANRNEPVARFFQQVNPWAVEKSKWCQNGTTNVITFCLEAPEGAIVEGDMSAVEYLNIIKLLYENWVRPGKRTECCTQPWLTNNVSNTVVVGDQEWDHVVNHIYDNRENFAGISLLAASGDKDYRQAPFTAVYLPEEIEAKYGAEVTKWGKQLLISALDLYDNDVFAASDDIMKDDVSGKLKQVFCQQCRTFCDTYGLERKTFTYLLKDLHNLRIWQYLTEVYQPVNYDEFIEEEDETSPEETVACAGGACSI